MAYDRFLKSYILQIGKVNDVQRRDWEDVAR